MINSKSPNLLPQEQLTLAHLHEQAEMRRYRQLALRLLPTAPDISRLMVALGIECEQRLEVLNAVAEKLGFAACLGEKESKTATPLAPSRRHFFVVNGHMAGDVLDEAVEAAHHSWHFFDALLATNATPELYRPLHAFVQQKHAEWQVLEERRQEWHLEARLP
ncbi:hypothetical protein [Halomonas sp. NO4]|uniref:hypothetical protein n=1 Tax=Halomonas sp. NO4 TaxID=2484813 RepID=UPI0013D30943|nr:hypothetical protein [Halomonas sp. NO4]